MFPDTRYGHAEVTLGDGDLLVLYSDGISEAMNPEREEYGQDRLARVVAEHGREPLDDLDAAIERDLGAFVEGVPFTDDRTLVMIRRTGA